MTARVGNPLAARLVTAGQGCGSCRHFEKYPPEVKGNGWGDGRCVALVSKSGVASDLPVTEDSGGSCLYWVRKLQGRLLDNNGIRSALERLGDGR